MIDPILLGDNALMGVDHLSQERARMRGVAEPASIVEMIRFVSDLGVNGFVVSTHPSLRNVIEYMIAHTDLHKRINFYPILPYVQGYVAKMTEKGVVGTISGVLEPATVHDKMRILIKGGIGLLKKDLYDLLKVLFDVELLQLQNVNFKFVFLHDVLTDLALALSLKDMFKLFIHHIEDRYGAEAGFVTKNFAMLVRRLEEWSIPMPPIMTSFNKVGFQMNPSREECEKCLKEHKVNVIAMSTLAAGYLNPKESFDYLFSLPNIRSLVVGASSKQHAQETFQLVHSYLNFREEIKPQSF